MSQAKLSYEERIAAIKEYREGKGSYNAIAKKYGIAGKKVWDSSNDFDGYGCNIRVARLG